MDDTTRGAAELVAHVETLAMKARHGSDDDVARLRSTVVDAIQHRGLSVEFTSEITGLREDIIAAWVERAASGPVE